MAVWWVSEPGLTIWFKDTPLRYQPSHGRPVEFTLFCRDSYTGDSAYEVLSGAVATLGQHWSTPWFCYVKRDTIGAWCLYTGAGGTIPFHGFSTSDDPYYADGWLDYRQRFTTFTGAGGERVVQYINGAQDVFGYWVTDGTGETRFFLTQRFDTHGNQLTFSYSLVGGTVYLSSITDPDGHQVSFSYSTINSLPLLTGVADQYNHTVALAYDALGNLTNITDAAGLSSGFEYFASGPTQIPYKLTTPYGTNIFKKFAYGTAVLVDEKGLGHHLYMYREFETSGQVPSSYAGYMPSTSGASFAFTSTFDGDWSDQRNSYYWNPRQYELLPGTFRANVESGNYDPTLLNSMSFMVGRQRHWLMDAEGKTGQTLSLERAPSPDGMVQGQITWYDYPGKPDYVYEGTAIQPSIIAWKLPNGESRFTYYVRNEVGRATNVIQTYSDETGALRVRTNILVYAANNVDLLSLTNAAGVRVLANSYNSTHELTASYNALGELTSYTHDSYGRLTSITQPGGLVTTNIYGADGYLAESRDVGVRTNYYTWANGLVYSQTDELGLRVTNTWDGLNRLRKRLYPDGTSITNYYQNLDLRQVTDRLGFTTSFEYNRLRQKTAAIDALNRTNSFGYCNCGELTVVSNALREATSYTYDYAGHHIQTLFPDNFWVVYYRDLLGRVTNILDSSGYSLTNWYNNQGLLVASRNACGQVSAALYDILDRTTSSTDASGITLSITYDALNRVRTRTYPDTGVEAFGYTANIAGPTSYTNQLNFVTRYGYDSAGRKTAETNANLEALYFAYDPAGNLKSLTDGKDHVTRWNYDVYGRATNKLDQAGTEILRYIYDPDNRLTNRWSVAKGNTVYRFDPIGNLTNIDYPSSPDVNLAYDPLNRVTNMVDAVGTTRYSFTAGGQLWTEDGPFSSDTVTNNYQDRLRQNLALQQPSGLWTNRFMYDAVRRLTNVTSPAGSFGYLLPSANPGIRVLRVSLPNLCIITNSFDAMGRLGCTWLKSGATFLDSAGYTYNLASQRTSFTNLAGTRVVYTHDNIGQLKIADSTLNTEDRGYAYDAAWNLSWRTNNASPAAYNVNSLNELTSGGGISYSYDGNGNRTTKAASGIYLSYTFDDENRLVSVYDVLNSTFRTDFVYDGLGRMRRRLEYTNDVGGAGSRFSAATATWVLAYETRYLYDGNRVIEERDGNNTPTVAYTRGVDLSGSLEGAGGIGGLLARSHGYSGGNWGTHSFYHADGNGNITWLVNSSRAVVASYRYDPFGNMLSKSGTLADVNVYRFSSKEFHANTGLYYYLYRFYDPAAQRWLNRDPVEEQGGLNLFSALSNDPTKYNDPLGLYGNPVSGPDGPVGGPAPPSWPPIIIPPIYDPDYWERHRGNNCYNYATDQPAGDYRQPCGGFPPGAPITCQALRARVLADGATQPTGSGTCAPGTHKIRLWANNLPSGAGGDFHFYRQDCNGSWSDKPGTQPVRRTPEAGSYGDYQNCGDLCVADQPMRF